MAHVTAFYGGTRRCRDTFVFEAALETHQHPHFDFIYLVATDWRARQLEDSYLDRFPSSFEIPIKTLPRFLRSIRPGEAGARLLSGSEKLLLIDELIASPQSPFVLQDTQPGLARRLSTFLSATKRQTILDSKMLALHWAKTGSPPLADQLAWLFSTYQRVLRDRRLEDTEGFQAALYQALMTGEIRLHTSFPRLQRIYLEGFSTISPLQRAVLRQIREQVDSFIISTDLMPGDAPAPSSPMTEMGHFLESVHDWKAIEGEGAPVPTATRLSDPEDEVRWVVSRIRRLTADADGQQIGIVTSQLERYRLPLERALREFDFDSWTFLTLPPGAEPGAALLLDYLELVQRNFPRRSLFDFLHHPWIQSGLKASELKLLEHWSSIARIDGDLTGWTDEFPTRIRDLAARGAGTGLDSPQLSPEPLLQTFDSLVRNLDLPRTPRNCRDWLSAVTDSMQRLLNPLPEDGQLPSQNRVRSLPHLLARVFRMGEWKQSPIALEEFSRLCRSQAKERTNPAALSDILIGHPTDLEHLALHHLFWIGLTDSEFSISQARSPVGVSADTGEGRESDWAERTSARDRRFDWIGGQAGRSLVYTVPGWDHRGPALTSPLLEDIGIESAHPPPLGCAEWPDTLANVQRGRKVVTDRESPSLSHYDGFLNSASLQREFRERFLGGSVHLSPTQLESYVNCGFRFFGERVLGIARVTEDGEVASRALGELLHRVLNRFMTGIETPPGDTRIWIREQKRRMLAIVEQEIAALIMQEPFRAELEWTINETFLKEGLQSDSNQGLLAYFILDQSRRLQDQRVVALEKRLRPLRLGTARPLNQSTPPLPVFLEGTVDRIDSGRDGLIVIDYKTGEAPLRRLYMGWGFQLPLYSLLVENHYRHRVGDRLFFQIALPFDVRTRTIPVDVEDRDEIWDRLIGHYKGLGLEVAGHLLAGRFPITALAPRMAGCPSCRLKDVCRYSPEKAAHLRHADQVISPRTLLKRGVWIGPDSREDHPA